jgi:hypothetical protein
MPPPGAPPVQQVRRGARRAPAPPIPLPLTHCGTEHPPQGRNSGSAAAGRRGAAPRVAPPPPPLPPAAWRSPAPPPGVRCAASPPWGPPAPWPSQLRQRDEQAPCRERPGAEWRGGRDGGSRGGAPDWAAAAPPGRPDSRTLTRTIGGAGHWRQLGALFAAGGGEWDAYNTSAALVRLAALHGRGRDACGGRGGSKGGAEGDPAELAQALLRRADALRPGLARRQVANIVWAAARLGAAPPAPLLARLLAAAAAPPRGLGGLKPQELTNLAYGLALLRPLYGEPRAPGASGSNGGGERSSRGGSGGGSEEELPWDDDFVLDLFDATAAALPACNARDAAQAAYSLSLLRPAAPRGWLAAWARRAALLLPEMGPQALANSAYGAARLAGPRGGAGLGWDAGGGGSGGGGSGDGGGEEGLHDAGGPDAADAAAARAWVGSALQYGALHAASLSARELIGQLLWAAGQLDLCSGGGDAGSSSDGGGDGDGSGSGSGSGAPPAAAIDALLSRAAALVTEDKAGTWRPGGRAAPVGAERRGGGATAGHVAVLLSAAARLRGGAPPPEPWQRACWAAVGRRLARDPGALSGPELCDLLAGAGALGMRPPRWLRAALLSAAADAFEAAGDARVAARAAYGAAAAGWAPGERWLVRFQAASRPLLSAFEPRDFANVAWALAAMGARADKRCAAPRGARLWREHSGGGLL